MAQKSDREKEKWGVGVEGRELCFGTRINGFFFKPGGGGGGGRSNSTLEKEEMASSCKHPRG